MQADNALWKKREKMLKDIEAFNLEYDQLEFGSVEALAMSVTIAAARIALSRLQKEIISKVRTPLIRRKL
jgi:hypothetical protein